MVNIDNLSKLLNDPSAKRKEFYTAPEFAKLIGFHEQTLRYWDRIGKFRHKHKTPGGTRMYAITQITELQDIYAADGLFNDPEARRIKPNTADASGQTED